MTLRCYWPIPQRGDSSVAKKAAPRPQATQAAAKGSEQRPAQPPRPAAPAIAQRQVIPFSELAPSRCLGGGSFGQVYLGRLRGTAVAIKVLSCGVPDNLPAALRALSLSASSVPDDLRRVWEECRGAAF